MMFILFTVLILGGCSGGGSNDTIFLSVVNVSPTDGANEIDEQAMLTATFNTEVDETTVNSASFRLSLDGTALAGTVESSGSIAVFTPAVALQQGRLYSAVITTSVHDLEGNTLGADYHWSFTTQGNRDITPPTVVLTDPQDGQTAPYLTSQVSAYFSEPVDETTLDTETFTLENTRGKLTGSVSYLSNKVTFDITQQRLDLRSRYTATITDFVRDSSGIRMTQDHTWDFVTLDGSWQNSSLIEHDDTGDASTPKVAFDSNGDAIAVWSQKIGGIYSIYVNHFDMATGSWLETPILIEHDDTGGAAAPQIACDGHGNAIVVWYQYDGTRTNIYANRYDAASDSWQSSATLIEQDNAGHAAEPQIAMNSKGDALAVWSLQDGTRYDIYANRFDAESGNWGSSGLIEHDNTGSGLSPHIAMDRYGNGVAVWRQNDGTRTKAYSNRYDAAIEAWQYNATLIGDNNIGDIENIDITIDGKGLATAYWIQDDSTSHLSVYANRYVTATYSWQSTPTLLEDNDASDAYHLQAAVNSRGDAVVAWHQYDGARKNIYANLYELDSSSWQSSATIIGNEDPGDATSVQVEIDESGNITAVWYHQVDTLSHIYSNRFDAYEKRWLGSIKIENDEVNNAFLPQVAVDKNGNTMAIWYQNDGMHNSIYANFFK